MWLDWRHRLLENADLDKFTSYIERELDPWRFHHSLGVGYMAVRLSESNGVDPVRACAAGLLHDCAKGLSREELQRIAMNGDCPVEPIDLEFPELLHAFVGAWRIRHDFGIDDPEVLDAVAFHPTGFAGASRLVKVVMAADYCEPTRDFPGVDAIRRTVVRDLDAGLLEILGSKLKHLQERGRRVHPRARGMMDELARAVAGRDGKEKADRSH